MNDPKVDPLGDIFPENDPILVDDTVYRADSTRALYHVNCLVGQRILQQLPVDGMRGCTMTGCMCWADLSEVTFTAIDPFEAHEYWRGMEHLAAMAVQG